MLAAFEVIEHKDDPLLTQLLLLDSSYYESFGSFVFANSHGHSLESNNVGLEYMFKVDARLVP